MKQQASRLMKTPFKRKFCSNMAMELIILMRRNDMFTLSMTENKFIIAACVAAFHKLYPLTALWCNLQR